MATKKATSTTTARKPRAASPAREQHRDRGDYEPFLAHLRGTFARTAAYAQVLFHATTNVPNRGLWDTFLSALPRGERQFHDCNACRHFVQRYGDLVAIDQADGSTEPVMWSEDGAPGIYRDAFAACYRQVKRSSVLRAFVTDERVWGEPVTQCGGEVWRHMHVHPRAELVGYPGALVKTPHQAAAERDEDCKMLTRSVMEFPPSVVHRALAIAESGALDRGEKVLGVLRWLCEVQGRAHSPNLLRLAAATAPAGFCHVRNTVAGAMLQDLADGVSDAEVVRRHGAKVDPLQYQRPQELPTAANVRRAEEVVAKLGSAGALRRRFARLDDLSKLWSCQKLGAASAFATRILSGRVSVFDAPVAEVKLPPRTMTWEKFRREVLPSAVAMQWSVVASGAPMIALLTAEDPTAPPILQWDDPEHRCPVNWYVYSGGSRPQNWGVFGPWADVSAVCLLPHMWRDEDAYPQHERGAVLVLRGCVDRGNPGLALFPEVLRSEYREVRATIEAHSRRVSASGREQASACGIDLRKGKHWTKVTLRVTSRLGGAVSVGEVTLDRWD